MVTKPPPQLIDYYERKFNAAARILGRMYFFGWADDDYFVICQRQYVDHIRRNVLYFWRVRDG